MNELQIFESPIFGTIRTLKEGGKVLFCAKDIAVALGYKRPKDAIAAHCKGAVKRRSLLIQYSMKRGAPQQAAGNPYFEPGHF